MELCRDDRRRIDNVYQLALTWLQLNIEYKFTLDGWTQQEMFEDGDACTSTIDGFVNRTIDVTEYDHLGRLRTVQPTSACDGTGGAEGGDITFQVDLSEYTGVYAMVNLNGTFNGWYRTCVEMTDDDGDDIYDVTMPIMPAGTIEYKFTLDGWSVYEDYADGQHPATFS